MKIITTKGVDPVVWDQFVTHHPLGTIYHSSLWQSVLHATYGFQPLYHLIVDDYSNIQAAVSSVLVKSWLTGNRIISYPFSDTCDPLVETTEQLQALMETLEHSRNKLGAHFVELRLAEARPFITHSPSQNEYSNYSLSLDKEPEVLFRTFHKNCIQRAIKKAKRQDLEMVTGNTEQDLKAFYRLHLMTRKKHGVPIQPFRFFRNLWNTLFAKNMLTLLLVRSHGKTVAGLIVLWFKNIAYYKFGASDERFLRLRVNQRLMWEAIRLAQQRDCRIFEFGRAHSANNGLAEYKGRWGTQKVLLHYLRVPNAPKHGAFNELSRKHALLKKVVTRMPSLINRMSGELLYKHFA